MKLLLLFCLPVFAATDPAPIIAGVDVTVSCLADMDAKQMFNGAVSKQVTICAVNLENNANEPVQVSESAVLPHITKLRPKGHAAAALIVQKAAGSTWQQQVSNVAGDLAALLSYELATKSIAASKAIIEAATGYVALAPNITKRFTAAIPSLQAHFDAIAWSNPVMLSPSASATAYVFVGHQGSAPPDITFTIPVTNLPAAKIAQ